MGSLLDGGPYMNKLLLNAIYFQGSLYSQQNGSLTEATDDAYPGMQFYSRFCELLGNEIGQASITTVLGLLICGTSLIHRGCIDSGWMYCWIANKMVIELNRNLTNPHSDSGDSVAPSPIDEDARDEAQRRLYLGAISIDVSNSLYLGRKPYFDAEHLEHLPPLLDTYEEMEDWVPYSDSRFEDDELHTSAKLYEPCVAHSVSTFEARVRLLRICSNILRMSDGDSQGNASTGTEGVEAEFHAEVLQWKSSLPAHLCFESQLHLVPPHQIELM